MGTLYIPRIFSEYSHRKPSAHPRGAEKWSFRGRKGASECVFAQAFREKPLSHAKPTVNTADQLFRHHKHEVKPPNRRNMWEIAVRNPRNGRNMWIFPIWNIERCETPSIFPRSCQTPLIFRKKFRNNVERLKLSSLFFFSFFLPFLFFSSSPVSTLPFSRRLCRRGKLVHVIAERAVPWLRR